MGVRALAWGVVGAIVALGCGEKVDCKRLCDREAECVAEIAVVLGTATPEQTALIKDDDRKALGQRQRDRCVANCTSPTKPGSVHTKWRGCLAAESCDAFARCVYR